MKILQYLQEKIREPIYLGFIISALIYIALFVGIFVNFNNSNTLKQTGESNFTMSLQSINTHANTTNHATSAPKPKPKPKPKEKPKPKPKKITKTIPVEKPKEVEPQPQTPETTDITKDDQKQDSSNVTQEGSQAQALAYNDGITDEFLSKIQAAIARKNKYPRIARIRGLVGDVTVEFILNMDGSIEGLKVLQSNAGDILNNAALQAVAKASKDFPLPTKRVRIKVPVGYHLTDD